MSVNDTTQKSYRYWILLFILVFGLMLLLGLYGFHTSEKQELTTPRQEEVSSTKKAENVNEDIRQYEVSVKNAQIIVPDTDIQVSLIDGRASYGTFQEGGDVFVSKVIGAVRVSENVHHVFADIAVQSGGTGVFHYVGLFEVDKNTITHLASTFIDDRIVLNKVTLISSTEGSYFVEIDFLGRDTDQALAEEPTISKKLIREVKKNAFIEIQPVAY